MVRRAPWQNGKIDVLGILALPSRRLPQQSTLDSIKVIAL
jgi:hypothetical protein